MPDLSVFSRLKTLDDYKREEEAFQIEKKYKMRANQGQDPAAIKIANEMARARQSGDVQRMNDIIMSAKMMDRGVVTDATGNPMAMGGYADAVGSISGTKSLYENNAKNESDLRYKPLEILSESQTKASLDYPKKEAQTKQMLDLLGSIKSDPGLSAVVGLPNPLDGRIPFIGNVAGSPAANFQAKLDQLGGKQFLEAFDSLKGGGQITEIEGAKATNAIARMQTNQSEESFKQALSELESIVQGALLRAKTAAVPNNQTYGFPDVANGQQYAVPPISMDDLDATTTAGAIPLPTMGGPQMPAALSKKEVEESLFNARRAIKQGKDRNMIIKRLNDAGIDTRKAGL